MLAPGRLARIRNATVEGQGLALVADTYVKGEINRGNLIKALDQTWPTQLAYYAVALPATHARPVVKKFVEWLRAL